MAAISCTSAIPRWTPSLSLDAWRRTHSFRPKSAVNPSFSEPHIWLVFVAAVWMQSWAGTGYLFGSISPVIKSALNYNQRQVASLGVAKDLGGSVGLSAGSLSEILPSWGALLVGVIQNFVGYGWIWLIVTGRAPVLPLWAMCILIFVGANGETYFNTAALVSCVQNFPESRGPVVGILKGFAGLSGAILTQLYTLIHSPDNASLIFMVVVGPTIVIIALMFIVRPVGGHRQIRSSDGFNFSIIYSICLLLAAYLMGVMLVQDLVGFSETVITIFTMLLLVILFIPIAIPVTLSFYREPRLPVEESLLPEPHCGAADDVRDIISGEIEAKKENVESPSASERQRLITQRQADLSEAAAEGVGRINERRLQTGEDCTLLEALTKTDFWLIFCSLLLGSGSGLTVIDNLGQMSQSLGYDNTHVFVSMISIWNFLGRVGGGYISEKIVSDYAYPRPAAMAGAQVIMAVGHFFFAMGWSMYVGTLLVGLGYGAHWAVAPAGASELFGLKSFGALYNFLTLANPMGSLVFSGVIASSLYDREAERQAHQHSLMSSFADEPLKCNGAICFFLSSLIMSGFCICSVVLSMILVYRTKMVYANLYGRSQQLTLDKK